MTIAANFAVRWLLSVLVALAAVSTHAGQNDNYPFSLDTEKTADGHRIVARNSGPAPVSVRVSLVPELKALLVRMQQLQKEFPI